MQLAITGINARMGLLTTVQVLENYDEYTIRGLDVIEPDTIYLQLRDMLRDRGHEFKQIEQYLDRVVIIQGDVRQPDDVQLLLKDCNIVLHLAFIVLPLKQFDLDRIYDININGSELVFKMAASIESVQKLIYLSSVAAYGKVTEQNLRIDETYPVNGSEFKSFYYSYCKGRVEEILDDIANNHPELIISRIRPHIVAGKHYFAVYKNSLFNAEIAARDKGNSLPIFLPDNHDEPLIQLVHENDVATVLFHAVTDIDSLKGAYNIGGEPVNQAKYYQSKGVDIQRIQTGGLIWYLLKIMFWIRGIFSSRHKVVGIWFETQRYPPIMSSSKIEDILGRKLMTTEEILDQFWSRAWESN